MNRASRRSLWVILITSICMFLMGALTVSAQAPTPINVGENKTGEVVAADVPVLYSVTVGAPMSINLQVLAITSGFAPNFRVLDPAGVAILDSANASSQATVHGSVNLSSSDAYTIEVSSANSTPGQFLISLEAGAPLAAPHPLTAGTPLDGTVDERTTRQAYRFSGTPDDVLLLAVRAHDATTGMVIALRDADSDELLALNGARLGGINYRILSGEANYLLEVTHGGASEPTHFVVCLATESASATCPGTPNPAVTSAEVTPTVVVGLPSLTPTFAPVALDPNGACQVTSARGTAINVRAGASTNNAIVGSLSPNGTGLVIGRLADNSWFQVNVNGVLGWVSATVVILGGNCGGISVVTLPTAIPPTALPPSVPTTSAPSQPTLVTPDVPAPRLNGNTYIGASLVWPIEGLGTDTYSYGYRVVGGPVDASYLGAGCAGYTTSQPTINIDYSANLFTFGVFFLSNLGNRPIPGNPNPTLIVQKPDGGFLCNDDGGPEGMNPEVVIYNAAAGEYHVWLGVWENTPFDGNFYLTMDPANHHP